MREVVIGIVSLGLVVIAIQGLFNHRTKVVRENEVIVQQYMSDKGCTPTNEFVGKHAYRLYACADGLKYPYDDLYSKAMSGE